MEARKSIREPSNLIFCPDHFFRASIELGDITPHNLKQLRVLNTVVFPVSYNDKFYIDVLEVRRVELGACNRNRGSSVPFVSS